MSQNDPDLQGYCPECVSCVDRAANQCPDCNTTRPSEGWPAVADSPYPYLGQCIDDRYLVDRFVDSGASGHVYRARGTRFNQQFAIKIVDLRRYDDEMRPRLVDRFYREVDTVAQIKNPHVIDIYEALELGDGIFGLVMNYVAGRTLDSILEELNRLSIDDAVSIAGQIANGLHEAHRRGIVHRDVKPENVIVEQMPAAGDFARILDFGVALSEESNENFGFQGTPLYASPEQCTEESSPDRRSDIYGLGCLLYHLLTGQPPFAYTNALRVMDAHVDAPRPRLADGTDAVQFPDSLDHLVGHLLARDPDDRPASLDVVHRALSAFEEGERLPDGLADRPAYRDADDSFSTAGLDSVTPPPEEFVSLGERTSSQLADESTMPDETDVSDWSPDGPVEMRLLKEFRLPATAGPNGSAVTATVVDPRGLACLVADASPSVHLMGLGGDSFEATFELDQMISAIDADLHDGLLLIGDVRARIRKLDPGSGRPTATHTLVGSPMALTSTDGPGRLVVGTERGQVMSLDLRTDSRHDIARFHHTVSALDSPDDRRLLAGLWDGSVAHLDQQRRRWHRPVAPDAIADVGLLDDQRYFAVDARGTLHIGDRQNGEITAEFEIGPGVRTIRQMSDGRLMILSIFDGDIQIWRLETTF